MINIFRKRLDVFHAHWHTTIQQSLLCVNLYVHEKHLIFQGKINVVSWAQQGRSHDESDCHMEECTTTQCQAQADL